MDARPQGETILWLAHVNISLLIPKTGVSQQISATIQIFQPWLSFDLHYWTYEEHDFMSTSK